MCELYKKLPRYRSSIQIIYKGPPRSLDRQNREQKCKKLRAIVANIAKTACNTTKTRSDIRTKEMGREGKCLLPVLPTALFFSRTKSLALELTASAAITDENYFGNG